MKNVTSSVGAIFGYLAGLLNLVAFVWYCWNILAGDTITNPVTWWLWLAETAISLILYADRTRDISKWLAEAVSMVGVIAVSLYLALEALRGDASIVFASVEPIDYIATIFGVLAFCVWFATRKKHGAGLGLWVFQLALLSAIFPLLRSTLADPSAEPFGPWALWTVAFCFQAICARIRWDGYEPLLNPINYAITHGLVAAIVWYGAASL